MRCCLPTLSTMLTLLAALPAQKLPVPGDGGRMLQLLDYRQLRAVTPPGPELRLPVPGDKPDDDAEIAANERAGKDATAKLLARFIEPPLGPGDDCRTLGDRWLAVLASPAQVASAERLFRTACDRREDLIEVEVRMLRVAEQVFTDKVATSLVQAQRGDRTFWEIVVDKEHSGELARTILGCVEEQLDCPMLMVAPLHHATMALKSQTAYVKDFTLTRVGEAVIANPVIDTVWDGSEIELIATFLPDGTLAVSCDMVIQELQKPIPEFETTLVPGAAPVKLQLPRVHGTRLRQIALLGEGALAVLAAQRADGRFLVALVSARVVPK